MQREFNLLDIWQVFVKRWLVILGIPLLAVGTSAVISLFVLTPQYRSSSMLIVLKQTDATPIVMSDIQVSRQLVATYREISRSPRVLENVISNLQLPYSVEELGKMVNVESVRDTELITIVATSSDPAMAQRIANEVVRSFMIEVMDIMQAENISIIYPASLPRRPVSPRLMLNLGLAFFLSLTFAVGLAFLLEYTEKSISDLEKFQSYLNITILGIIPDFLKLKKRSNHQVVSYSNPRSPVTEAYRTLRTNIQFASLDRPARTFLIAGGKPGCGKTSTIANLGVTLAQVGSTVLLVDTDLRRPMLHKYFDILNDYGLTNLLLDDTRDLSSIVIQSGFENLDILTSGPLPPNPAELLSTERMKAVVGALTSAYDYVLFDSPPIIAVTDAAILSQLVDGTILVFEYNVIARQATRDVAVYTIEQFRKVKANIIGGILNGMPINKSQYYSYQYYYGDIKTADTL